MIDLGLLQGVFRECFKEVLPTLCKELEIRELKRIYPKWVKGNIKASEILGITPNALTQRVAKGVYKENLHFKKKSPRIYLWDRDTLINERSKSEII